MKPAWQTGDGRVKLYLGDALKIMPRLDAGCANLVILDPPYGSTDLSWDVRPDLDEMWAAVKHVRVDNAVACGFGCQPFFTDLISSNRREFRYDLVWSKQGSACGFLNANRMPLRAHESIAVFAPRGGAPTTYHPQFTPGKPYRSSPSDARVAMHYRRGPKRLLTEYAGRRHPVSVLTFPKAIIRGKPGQTRKPTDLIRWLLRAYSDADDTVIDPFLGSGSTAEAAIAEGRRVIGIELARERFALSKQQIKAALANRTARAAA